MKRHKAKKSAKRSCQYPDCRSARQKMAQQKLADEHLFAKIDEAVTAEAINDPKVGDEFQAPEGFPLCWAFVVRVDDLWVWTAEMFDGGTWRVQQRPHAYFRHVFSDKIRFRLQRRGSDVFCFAKLLADHDRHAAALAREGLDGTPAVPAPMEPPKIGSRWKAKAPKGAGVANLLEVFVTEVHGGTVRTTLIPGVQNVDTTLSDFFATFEPVPDPTPSIDSITTNPVVRESRKSAAQAEIEREQDVKVMEQIDKALELGEAIARPRVGCLFERDCLCGRPVFVLVLRVTETHVWTARRHGGEDPAEWVYFENTPQEFGDYMQRVKPRLLRPIFSPGDEFDPAAARHEKGLADLDAKVAKAFQKAEPRPAPLPGPEPEAGSDWFLKGRQTFRITVTGVERDKEGQKTVVLENVGALSRWDIYDFVTVFEPPEATERDTLAAVEHPRAGDTFRVPAEDGSDGCPFFIRVLRIFGGHVSDLRSPPERGMERRQMHLDRLPKKPEGASLGGTEDETGHPPRQYHASRRPEDDGQSSQPRRRNHERHSHSREDHRDPHGHRRVVLAEERDDGHLRQGHEISQRS